MIKKIIIIFGLIVLVTACASTKTPTVSNSNIEKEILVQEQEQIATKLKYLNRLDRLFYPLNKAALPFCHEDKTFSLGIRVIDKFSFGENLINVTKKKLGVNDDLVVFWTIKNSPSEQFDIQKGDKIMSINGGDFKKNENKVLRYREYLKEAYKKDSKIEIKLERGNKEIVHTIPADTSCDYTIKVELSKTINAFADGSTVRIYSGIMNVFNDNYLSFIIAHEIAHNTQGHIAKIYTRLIVGGTLGAVISPNIGVGLLQGLADGILLAYFLSPTDLEKESDYVGLYIIARSDINLTNVEEVWRKFSSETERLTHATFYDTHPTHPYRYLAMKKTIKEIEEKKLKNIPLLPNN